MRDLLSDSEAARILGKRRTQLYRIVDRFDADPNDEWELEEGLHFEFAGPAGRGWRVNDHAASPRRAWRPWPATSRQTSSRIC